MKNINYVYLKQGIMINRSTTYARSEFTSGEQGVTLKLEPRSHVEIAIEFNEQKNVLNVPVDNVLFWK